MTEFNTDVLIVGGGPSGTSAALSLLLHTGLKVTLIDHSAFDNSKVGEHIDASLFKLLEYLEIGQDQFEPGSFVEGYSSLAAWGNDHVVARHSIYNVESKSYQLDREQFDLLMLQKVADRGGEIFPRTRCIQIDQLANGNWQLLLRHQTRGEFKMNARFLIDASGRQSHVCRLLKINTIKYDQLVGIVTFLHFKDNSTLPQELFIETAKDGWWYCATLPNQRMTVTFFTDADIVKDRLLQKKENWNELLAATRHIRQKTNNAFSYDLPITRNAFSHITETTTYNNFLAVGDAVAAFDPVSSMGIGFAMSSACNAARAVNSFFEGDATQVQAYHNNIREIFGNYLDIRSRYYQTEQRWPESPFWQRRLIKSPA